VERGEGRGIVRVGRNCLDVRLSPRMSPWRRRSSIPFRRGRKVLLWESSIVEMESVCMCVGKRRTERKKDNKVTRIKENSLFHK
jgi:hypothetical protein